MKKIAQKDMKIDDLAIMVGRGFRGIEEKFDIRFNTLEDRLTDIETKLSDGKDELEGIKEVTKNTRQDVLNIGEKFVSRHEFNHLVVRVGHAEQKLEKKR